MIIRKKCIFILLLADVQAKNALPVNNVDVVGVPDTATFTVL
jgi:hypothetical protein